MGPPIPQHAAALKRAMLPFDGLRVISNVMIMVFHHAMLRQHFGDGPLNDALRSHPRALHAVLGGHHGLEPLFLMCGFLAALSLVPLLTDPRRSIKKACIFGGAWRMMCPAHWAVLLYYWRRAARIVPAHWVSLLLSYLIMVRGRRAAAAIPEAASALAHYPPEFCPGGLWDQAFFLGHWQMGGCGLYLWSQRTQMTFWVVVPLLLAAAQPRRAGFKRRIAIGAGIIMALSTAYRAWAVWYHNIQAPVVIFQASFLWELINYLHNFHCPLISRAASLAIGCLLALLFLDTRSLRFKASRRSELKHNGSQHTNGTTKGTTDVDRLTPPSSNTKTNNNTNEEPTNGDVPRIVLMPPAVAVFGTVMAAQVVWYVLTTSLFIPVGDPQWPRTFTLPYLTFVLQGGVIGISAFAFVMAVAMTQAGPAGPFLHALLSARMWQPLASLTYSAYLYHEQVRFWLYRYGVLPSGLIKSADDLWGFALDMAVTLLATFAAACVSYNLVELPAAKVARRIEPKLFDSSSGASDDGHTPAANGHVTAKAA